MASPTSLAKKENKECIENSGSDINDNSEAKYDAIQWLLTHNIIVGHKIDKTLQGSIYSGTLIDNISNKRIDIVIKRARKILHKRKMGVNGNKLVDVGENIVSEYRIMKHILNMKPPNGFLKEYGLKIDDRNIFLIMEYGGKSLFNHCKKYHYLIKTKKISINEWKKHVKIIFKQLVIMVYFLHNKARVCHMDISLENILIKGCVINNGKFTSHGQVYFCDFGLSQYFSKINADFLSDNFIGKIQYQSPEVYSKKKPFDARKADIWSLGVVLFMLQFGVQPFEIPSIKDNHYKNIIHGYLSRMITDNGMGNYSSKWFTNIINNILTLNHKRWNINILLNKI